MSGKPSSKTVAAMYLIQSKGMCAHQAAKRVGIAVSTIYRSNLYRAANGLPVFKQTVKGK